MNAQTKLNRTLDERSVITSRRTFLKNVAWGSLLAVGGSTVVEAAAKHVAKAPAAKSVAKASSKATTKVAAKSAPVASKSKHGHDAVAHHAEKNLDKHKAAKHETVALSRNDKHHSDKHDRHADKHDHERHSDKHELAKKESHHASSHHLAEQHHTSPRRVSHQLSTHHHHIKQPIPQVAKAPVYEYEYDDQYNDAEHDDDANIISYDDEPLQRIYRPTFANTITHRELFLQNPHIDDMLKLTYFEKGQYLPDALEEISYLFQDHMNGDVHPIDVALLDQLHDLKQVLGVSSTKPIHIVCGYRSPTTNAYLRARSKAVAKNSLHMQGRAIDIRMEGISSRNIRDAALTMARGGVGYYPRSNFVHLDTGNFRTW